MSRPTEQQQLETAHALLTKHGLDGWQIHFRDLSRVKGYRGASSYGVMGLCIHHERLILIDSDLIGRQQFLQTAKHEIGHAVAGPGAGHGSRWRELAKKVGCSKRHLESYK
jgi:hypothetical protein